MCRAVARDASGILAIDPAWTPGRPSGVAALTRGPSGWHCAAVAPSADSFLALAHGVPVDWDRPASPGLPPPPALLGAARQLVGEVAVASVDMPVARVPFSTRRVADNEISRVFGAQGCSTHSPTTERPGVVGRALSEGFRTLGYEVGTTVTPPGTPDVLLEAYPHPALLYLLGADYRVPYKVQGSARYWPELPPDKRRAQLLGQWHRIRDALGTHVRDIDLPLPDPGAGSRLAGAVLKRLEDALDALICAFIAVRYLEGDCHPYGDETAAIWVPGPPRSTTLAHVTAGTPGTFTLRRHASPSTGLRNPLEGAQRGHHACPGT